MNSLTTFLLLAIAASALLIVARRLASTDRSRLAQAARICGFAVAMFAIYHFHVTERSEAARKVSATLEILEASIQRDDKQVALEIVDRGIRYLGSNVSPQNAEKLLTFASHVSQKKPNQALEPTPIAVTDPAAQAPRQP